MQIAMQEELVITKQMVETLLDKVEPANVRNSIQLLFVIFTSSENFKMSEKDRNRVLWHYESVIEFLNSMERIKLNRQRMLKAI